MLRVLMLGVLAAGLVGQEPEVPATETRPIAQQIRESAYIDSQAEAELFYLCDRVGGRLSGSEELRAAAEHCRKRLAAQGFEARVDRFEIPDHWTRGAVSARLVTPVERELSLVAAGWSPGIAGSELLELSLDPGAKRAAVLLDPDSHPLNRGDHPAPTARLLLIDAQRPYNLLPTGLATWAPPFAAAPVPTAFVGASEAALLRRLIEAGAKPQLEVEMRSELIEGGESVEVVAELRGRDKPDEVVLAIAWLDSWDLGPGAADDAAGCVALLEAARVLAALPERPRRTIRIALLSGGAQGLGTSGYLSRLDQAERNKLVGGFAIEGGGGRLLGLALSGEKDWLERAEGWFAPVKDLGVSDIGFRASARDRAKAMREAGIPLFAFVQEAPELDLLAGTAADTPDRILDLDLMQAACVVAQGLWAWAEQE